MTSKKVLAMRIGAFALLSLVVSAPLQAQSQSGGSRPGGMGAGGMSQGGRSFQPASQNSSRSGFEGRGGSSKTRSGSDEFRNAGREQHGGQQQGRPDRQDRVEQAAGPRDGGLPGPRGNNGFQPADGQGRGGHGDSDRYGRGDGPRYGGGWNRGQGWNHGAGYGRDYGGWGRGPGFGFAGGGRWGGGARYVPYQGWAMGGFRGFAPVVVIAPAPVFRGWAGGWGGFYAAPLPAYGGYRGWAVQGRGAPNWQGNGPSGWRGPSGPASGPRGH